MFPLLSLKILNIDVDNLQSKVTLLESYIKYCPFATMRKDFKTQYFTHLLGSTLNDSLEQLINIKIINMYLSGFINTNIQIKTIKTN